MTWEPHRGKTAKLAFWAGLLIALLLCPIFIRSPYLIHVFNLTFIYIIVAVSFRTIMNVGAASFQPRSFHGDRRIHFSYVG